MTWQPIETAPRDGTYVLVWNTLSEAPIIAMYEGAYWEDSYEGCTNIKASHWMPLPEAP